jgi:hypothetical protein
MDFEGEDETEREDTDDLQALKKDALTGMREHLANMLDGGGEAGYSGADIGECGRILDAYLARIAATPPGYEEGVMAAVQETVLALNVLNERCGCHLIETDQREQIGELINRAAAEAGVGSGEDLTETWREW